jgi:hypothetical protein
MSLSELWARLEQRDQLPNGLIQQSAHATVGSAVSAGLRFPERQRVLLIRLPRAQGALLLQRGIASGMVLRGIASDYPEQVLVEISTTDRQYQELFAHIGDDLVGQLVTDPPRPGEVIVERLELWRSFFRHREGIGLSVFEIQGLYGELWFLREHVLPHLPGLRGIGAWTGTSGATHDFTMGQVSLDMKTGTPDGDTVHISSLQQLMPPPETLLFLGHLKIRRDSQGQSVGEIIDELRRQLPTDALQAFEGHLISAGYLEAERHTIDSYRFVPRSFELYQVSQDFPALTRSRVPNQIESCSYTIRLAACQAFRRDVSQLFTPAGDQR